jgi:hypothetical protein
MKHHPACECDFCFTDDLNAVLRRFLEQREARRDDRDAEQLAREIVDLRDELARMP